MHSPDLDRTRALAAQARASADAAWERAYALRRITGDGRGPDVLAASARANAADRIAWALADQLRAMMAGVR